MRKSTGFTLIELLIVVAIIGILAAIAIPNFLQAQVRAKVARAVSEQRNIEPPLELYHIDHNAYPLDGGNCSPGDYWYLPVALTTPTDYISSTLMIDPFREGWYANRSMWWYERYRYQNIDDTWGNLGGECSNQSPWYDEMLCLTGHWAIHSLGPNRYYGPTGYPNSCNYPDWPYPYDPTNGTISDGNIMRTQKDAKFEYK